MPFLPSASMIGSATRSVSTDPGFFNVVLNRLIDTNNQFNSLSVKMDNVTANYVSNLSAQNSYVSSASAPYNLANFYKSGMTKNFDTLKEGLMLVSLQSQFGNKGRELELAGTLSKEIATATQRITTQS